MEAVKQVSSRAEQQISEYGLGSAQAEYKGNMLKNGLLAAIFLPLGLLILAFILPTLFFPSFTADDTWLSRLGNLFSGLLTGSCFSLLGLFGMINLILVLWKGEQRVYIGERGFISMWRKIELVASWEAVRETRRRILFTKSKANNVQQVFSSSSYTIVSAEGKMCSIFAEPGPAIERAVTTCLYPQTLEDYIGGKTLSFGWLTLEHEGLRITSDPSTMSNDATALTKLPTGRTLQKLHGTCVESGEHFLPWEKLACYWIDESYSTFIVSKKDERKHWAILPLYQVPNSALCLSLIEYVLSGSTRTIA
jgi:hypothetical protein